MIDTILKLTVAPGFGGGSSAPPPAPLPPAPLPPAPPTAPPDPPKPVKQADVVAKRSAKKQATQRTGHTSTIKTSPSGLLDEDADTTKKTLIGG
jgi:hypothetical protein